MKYLALLAFFFLFPLSAYSTTDIVNDGTLSTGLVACYELDESSGTREDSSSSGNDLTDINTVTSASAIVAGSSAHFTPTYSEYLSITDASQSGLDVSGNFTLAAWINLDNLPSSQFSVISKDQDSNRGYNMLVRKTGSNYFLRSIIAATTSTPEVDEVAWTPSTSTDYHIAITYNGSAGELKYYVNGSQQGTTQTASASSIVNNAASFRIGAFNTGPEAFFDGSMDVVAVWNVTLSGTSISDLYNSGDGIPCVSDAAPYLQFFD